MDALETKKQSLSEEDKEYRKAYYGRADVINDLLAVFKNREVVFMDRLDSWKSIRGLSIRNLSFLKTIFDYYRFLDKDYNIYVSVASYRYIPMFPMDLRERSKATSKWFSTESYKYIYGYDYLFDFDYKGDFVALKAEVMRLCAELYRDYVFFVFPSGTGFQLIIPDTQFHTFDREFINEDGIIIGYNKTVMKAIQNLKEKLNLNHLCMNNNGQIFKIRKAEYSLVKDYCLTPLNPSYIEKFEYANVKRYIPKDDNRVLIPVK